MPSSLRRHAADLTVHSDRSTPCPSSPSFTLDRRGLLRLAGGGALAVTAVGAVAGCAQETPVAPDPLVAQETSARADAVAATAAIAALPERAAALRTVADQRTAHADALRTEIDRVIGVYGDGTTPAHRTPPVTPTAPATPPALTELRTALTDSQRSAAELAATLSGYRAALLASISAACATHAGVLLA